MDQQLLDILACPACRGRLSLLEEQDGLLCAPCKKIYPIEDDVPFLVVDAAVPQTSWQSYTLRKKQNAENSRP